MTTASRYALAVLSAGAALGLTLLLGDLLATTRIVLFFAAVVLASWSAGFGPGLLASLLSAVAIEYFFNEPRYSFINLADIPALIIFIIAAITISWLSAGRKRVEQSLRRALDETEAKVGQRAADLMKANESLKAEITRREETEREREELVKRLATERALFEAVLRQMPAGVVVSEAPSGKVIMGNEQVAEILRHPFKLVNGVKQYETEYACYDREGRAYEPERMPLARSLLTGEVVTDEEIHFERGDGTVGYVMLSSTPVRDGEGRIVAAVAVFHDVTEQIEAATELKHSRERYYELFENANDVVYTLDLEGKITSLNKAGERVTGYSRDELIGKSVAQFVAPEHIARMQQMMARKVDGEAITTYELQIEAKDGRRVALEVSSRLVYEMSEPVGIQGIARDITERKLVEEALRQSEERFSKAFSASPHLVTISTLAEGRYLDVNEAVVRATGYAREELVGRTIADLNVYVNPQDRVRLLEAFEREGHVREMEIQFRAKGGHAITVLLSAEIITLNGEKCLLTASNDITERKLVEEALRASEERFAKAFQASPLALTITSLKTGKLIEVNETFTRVSGYTREEAVGRSTIELGLWAKQADREAELAMVASAGQVRNIEYRFRMKDGTELVGLLSAERLEIEGEPCALTVIEDITERRRIETERERLFALEHAARREAETANRMKDEFLATVSHELRTPLNAILGWADLLRSGRLEPELAARGLDTIARNAKAQAQLIEDILDVSRIITGKLRLDARPVELIPIINAAIDAVRPAAFAKEIDLQVMLDPVVGSVTGDGTRLQQVVWNLLSNAIKFTPPGGRVEARLEQSGRLASIIVRDTGAGIDKEFLPYVFDRFRQGDSSYTRHHGGLGLGLAIVRHLVEMHGGTVEAESDGEGYGATFLVNLPVIQSRMSDFKSQFSAGAVDARPQQAAGSQAGSMNLKSAMLAGLSALVVDDEPDARELIKIALEQYGAKVVTAASAAEALAALNQCEEGDRPDVILSDIGMPGEDGLSLITKMRAAESIEKIPAIALTAYARDEDRERALKAGYEMHISKPFNPSELAEAVSSLTRKNNGSED